MYTLQTLREINPVYHHRHTLGADDVERVNALIAAMTKQREGQPMMIDGDQIICVNEALYPAPALVHNAGHLQRRGEGFAICVYPYTPFVASDLSTAASSGPWIDFEQPQGSLYCRRVTYAGKTLKRFLSTNEKKFGAGTSVEFEVEVNQWRINDTRFHRLLG